MNKSDNKCNGAHVNSRNVQVDIPLPLLKVEKHDPASEFFYALPVDVSINERRFSGYASVLTRDHPLFQKLAQSAPRIFSALNASLSGSTMPSNKAYSTAQAILRETAQLLMDKNFMFIHGGDANSLALVVRSGRYRIRFDNNTDAQSVARLISLTKATSGDIKTLSAAALTQAVKYIRLRLSDKTEQFVTQELWTPVFKQQVVLDAPVCGTGDAIQVIRQLYKTPIECDLLCDALKLFLPRGVNGLGLPKELSDLFEAWNVNSATAYISLTHEQRRELEPFMSSAGRARVMGARALKSSTLSYDTVREIVVRDAAIILSRFIFKERKGMPRITLDSGPLFPEFTYKEIK